MISRRQEHLEDSVGLGLGIIVDPSKVIVVLRLPSISLRTQLEILTHCMGEDLSPRPGKVNLTDSISKLAQVNHLISSLRPPLDIVSLPNSLCPVISRHHGSQKLLLIVRPSPAASPYQPELSQDD